MQSAKLKVMTVGMGACFQLSTLHFRLKRMEFRSKQTRKSSRSRFEVAMRQRQAVVRTHMVSARLRLVLFVGVLVSGILAISYSWYTGETWRISIDQIKVLNNKAVPTAQILGASGIEGEHLQWVDLDAAAARVNELPGIQAAQLTCTWDLKAHCMIQVQETRALAIWQSAQGNVWADGEGHVQRMTGEGLAGMALQAPVLISMEEGAPPSADKSLDPRLLRAIAELVKVQPKIKHYLYSNEFGLMYMNERNWRVRLGLSEHEGAIGEKLALASKLSESIVAHGGSARVLDVRFLQSPFYLK